MMRYSQNCYMRVETFKNLKGFQELDKVFVQLLNHKVKIIKLLKKKKKECLVPTHSGQIKGEVLFICYYKKAVQVRPTFGSNCSPNTQISSTLSA